MEYSITTKLYQAFITGQAFKTLILTMDEIIIVSIYHSINLIERRIIKIFVGINIPNSTILLQPKIHLNKSDEIW